MSDKIPAMRAFYSFLLVVAVLALAGCPSDSLLGNLNTNPDDDSTAGISVTGVSLDRPTLSLVVAGTYRLTATVAPSDADDKTVSWASNATSVATVSTDGTVTAVAAGTATITVTTTDGGKTATCVVTVTTGYTPPSGTEFTDTSAVYSDNFHFGYVSPNNVGGGQLIVKAGDYVPTSFSVFIDALRPVYKNDTTPDYSDTYASVFDLRIWNKSNGTLYGSASASVAKDQTGEVEFTINGAVTIPAGVDVIYAVVLRDAASNQLRTWLNYHSGGGTDGYYLYRTAGIDDASVYTFAEWEVLSASDLQYSLTGIIPN